MKKPILLILFTSLLLSLNNSCCRNCDDDPNPVVDPPNTGIDNPQGGDDNPPIDSNDEITLDLEGVNSIDYTKVTATSISHQNTISNNGVFDNPYEPNDIQDLPVLLLENEEILTGYYLHTLTSNKVTIDDFLFYHFKSYPRMLLKNISDNVLSSEIKILFEYEDLKSILVSSLNSNVSPLDNEIFIQSIRSFAEKDFTGKTGKDIVGDFYFEYNRNGLTSWPNEIALYASVGFIIRDKQTGEIVFGPELLKTNSIDFGLIPVVNWLQAKFGDPISRTDSFQFTESGEYEIILTNGLSGANPLLDQAVLDKNKDDFSALVISLVTAGLAKALEGDGSCNEALQNLYTTAGGFFLTQNQNPTDEQIEMFIEETGAELLSSTGDCFGGVVYAYFSAIIKSALSLLNAAADIYELRSLFKDSAIVSNINITENRFFNNNVSFGALEITDESEKEFSGVVADNLQYSITITEKGIFYDVESSETSPSSFIPDISDEGAKDLPFKYEIVSGDALIPNGPIFKTQFDGALNFNMTMGNEDSEILIYPDFESTVINQTSINLTNLENDVLVIEGNTNFGDVAINQSKEEVFTITNRSDNVMTINQIITPDGFSSVLSDGTGALIEIEPQGSKTTIIEFNPTVATPYSGTITFVNNVFQENNTITVTGNGTDENNEVDLTGYWTFLWENVATGSTTSYDSQGEVLYVVADPIGDFLYNVRFDSNGELIVTGSPESATYSNSSGLLTINVTYDRSNYIQIFSFSGTWSEQQSAFIGSGTLNSTQWSSNERIRKSSEGDANFQQLTLFK
ncbi:hypothetical protein KCTC52924_03221 [Arenibacter antarcticus]|uniref:Abnormal spindle-like microcephaly-associated protein ASH domain-containing protein n=1 Tax=Arenibacter antarcticus TaxID=2040469 RepID=A0ABW5VF29_9FLAO|nr:hypothetical protein [Arenibacter sp. H213]MCM4166293.1 hypothetical protein [Arenibacter sp. H213]